MVKRITGYGYDSTDVYEPLEGFGFDFVSWLLDVMPEPAWDKSYDLSLQTICEQGALAHADRCHPLI